MKFFSLIKTYPYKERLPYAALMLCVLGWMLRNSRPGTLIEVAFLGVLGLTLFCGPKSRPFWFFWGVLIGGFLMALNNAHPWTLR